MRMPSTGDLTTLLEHKGPCATFYLPFHPGKRELRADLLVLKNQIDAAEPQLADLGVRPTDARAMLKPASELIEDLGFWQERGQGVALFINRHPMRAYHLPFPVEEVSFVGHRFYCKPLLTALAQNQHFLLLAVSRNGARLLRCTMYTHEPVELAGVPQGMEDFFRHDERAHPGTAPGHPAPVPAEGRRPGGAGPEHLPDSKDQVFQYFRKVDDAVLRVARDERTPLVLAGEERMVVLYREASRYPAVHEASLTGSPDRIADAELVGRARELIRPRFEAAHAQAADRFNQFIGTGKASTDLKEVLTAAAQGRVANLFLKGNLQKWGRFDPNSGNLEVHDRPTGGDDELFDLAAGLTHLQRGTVWINSRVPRDAEIAAEFRY